MQDNRAVQDFYTNVVLRDSVRTYIEAVFKKEAIDKVMKREDVSHVADAMELLNKAFSEMTAEFEPIKQTNQNSAR